METSLRHPLCRRARLLLSLAAAAWGVAGCRGFWPTADLALCLPGPPAHWLAAFPDLGAVIELPAGEGKVATVRVERWGDPLEVSIPKEGNGPLLAWPAIGDGAKRLLRPAGALYPGDLATTGAAGESIVLSWEAGPLAVLVAGLRLQGFDVQRINARRLREEMAREADPWAWDLAAIGARLVDGTFSVDDMDPLPWADVRVTVAPGAWFLESPFQPPAAVDGAGMLELPGLSFGAHTLLAAGGGMMALWLGREGLVVMPGR